MKAQRAPSPAGRGGGSGLGSRQPSGGVTPRQPPSPVGSATSLQEKKRLPLKKQKSIMKKKDSRTKLGDIQNEENVSGNGILMKRNISWRDDDEDVDLELSPKNVMITFPNSGRRASYSISMDHLSKDPLKITDEDRENPTPFSACKLSDAEMLAKFLDDPENILDINEKDDNGWTLLMTASAVGAHACVELLLERGAEVNLRDEIGQTALFCAAFDGHPDIVETLLLAGANRSIKDNDDILPGQLFSDSVPEEVQDRVIFFIKTTVPKRSRKQAPPKRSCCAIS